MTLDHRITPDRLELDAYNGTFWDLGFRWQWDAATYREASLEGSDETRVLNYIARHQPHLLVAYDGPALARIIVEHKTRRATALRSARAAGVRAELTCHGIVDA